MNDLVPYMDQILASFQTEERSAKAPMLENEGATEDPMSRRERQTLSLLATELSPKEIASELGISEYTVRTHIRNIFRKLDVHSRLEAVQRARALNLLQPERIPRRKYSN